MFIELIVRLLSIIYFWTSYSFFCIVLHKVISIKSFDLSVMNIHEYQAKIILSQYGIKVPQGFLALTPEEAVEVASCLKTKTYVVKAQVHAGGRGKAGGIKLAKNLDEVREAAKQILGMTLKNEQTGSEGKIVRKIYIEEGSNIKKELYLSLILNRKSASITIIASEEGGMDIEEVAALTPEKVINIDVDPSMGLQEFHIRKVAFSLNLEKNLHKEFAKTLRNLYQAFVEKDAMQIEINPLVITEENSIIPIDAKFSFDDSALYKHEDIANFFDPYEEDHLEVKASQNGINYVRMQGEIGCMVNGAGLAMATMDIINLYGGSPANFLDVGGTADEERVLQALNIITEDSNVKGILINIFGGIVRCDIIARGLINAAKAAKINIPIVVRLAGTNSELGMEILKDANIALYPASDVDSAAKQIVELTR